MPATVYEKIDPAIVAMNAINISNLTDGQIPALTTAAGLKALIANQSNRHFEMKFDDQRSAIDIQAAIDAGIFNDTNVDGAATVNALRDILIAANPNLNRASFSGTHWWQ